MPRIVLATRDALERVVTVATLGGLLAVALFVLF